MDKTDFLRIAVVYGRASVKAVEEAQLALDGAKTNLAHSLHGQSVGFRILSEAFAAEANKP